MSEPVEAYDDNKEKQDCESKAFARLAKKLKAASPHQGFCIIGDALYACRPVMDICRANKWEFVLTFKEGVMPKVWDEVCQVQRRVGKSSFQRLPDEDWRQCHVGVVAWVDARETAYENGTGHDFRVVKHSCWDAGAGKYNGAFATSLEVCETGVRFPVCHAAYRDSAWTCGAYGFARNRRQDEESAKSTSRMEREEATKARTPTPFGISAESFPHLLFAGSLW